MQNYWEKKSKYNKNNNIYEKFFNNNYNYFKFFNIQNNEHIFKQRNMEGSQSEISSMKHEEI